MTDKMRKIEMALTVLFSASFLMLALALTVLLTNSSNRVLQKNTANLMAAESGQLQLNINRYLQDVEETAALLFSDPAYYEYDASVPGQDAYSKIKHKELISARINDLGLMQNFSDFGIIYANDERIGSISQVTRAMFPDGGMYEAFSRTITDDAVGDGWSFGHKGNSDRLYYAKRLNPHAIVLVSFFCIELESVFIYPEQLHSMTIRLVDEKSRVLFSTDSSEIGCALSLKIPMTDQADTNSAVVRDNYLVTTNTCGNGWRVVCTIPVEDLIRENMDTQHRTIVHILILVFLILLAGFFINYKISRSVKGIFNNLSRKAEYDQMTGLLNKADFQNAATSLMSRKNQKQAYCFVMLDLDNFKRVNDTLGHAAGDRVITETAAIIRRRFDDQFLIGRIGGDEFAVFRTSAVWSAKDFEKTVQSCMDGLYAEFDRVFEEERARCSVSVSAGCVCTAKGFYSFEDLYELADRMLYKSKHNGKNELNSCCISEEDVTEFMRMEKGGEQT